VAPDQLRETIDRLNLWKWDPAQITAPGRSRPEDEDRQHLETYLGTLAQNRRLWSVPTVDGLVERATEALGKEGYLLASMERMLRDNPALLHAPEQQMREQGAEQLKKSLPSTDARPPEEIGKQLS